MECFVRSQNHADDMELLRRLLQTVDDLLDAVGAGDLDQRQLTQAKLRLLTFKSVIRDKFAHRSSMRKPRIRVAAGSHLLEE